MKENIFNIQRFAQGDAPMQSTSGESLPYDAGTADLGAENTAPEKVDQGNKSFDDLIRGEYKQEYGKRVEAVVKKRLRDHLETKQKLKEASDALDDIRAELGVTSSDPREILNALRGRADNDAVQVEAQGADPKKEEGRDTAGDSPLLSRAFSMLAMSVEQAKEYFPSFDAVNELRDPFFLGLVKLCGGDMKRAYEMKYHDMILTSLIGHATRTAKQQLAQSVSAAGQRPPEGAAQGESAVSFITDPKSLSKTQRAEIKRRVRKGERVIW